MISLIQGPPGAGKSYVAVNEFMAKWLTDSTRHIYTNLPLRRRACGTFELICRITRNPAKRAAMQERLHLLEDRMDDAGEWTDPETGKVEKLGMRHRTKEFWYFTKPNSVIFLDELAEIYDARDRASEPETLATYVRLHRHFKDDFYGFTQDRRDTLPRIRRLAQYVWTVKNSTKTNMVGWWALRGLKWPVQFFIVRCYLGAEVREDTTFEQSAEPQEAFTVWPSRKGFKAYDSFNKAGPMPWKSVADETAKSSDVNQGFWGRVGGVTRQVPLLVGICGALGIGGYMVHRMFDFLLHPPVDQMFKPGAQSQSVSVLTNAAPSRRPGAGSTNFPGTARTAKTPDAPGERLVLVVPGRAVTDAREIYEGDSSPFGRLERVLPAGVVVSTGSIPWRVFLSSGSSASGGRGGRDESALRGIGFGSGG